MIYRAEKHGDLLTPAEAAEVIGSTPNTLSTWRHHGRGPICVRKLGRVFCPSLLLNKWLEQQQTLIVTDG